MIAFVIAVAVMNLCLGYAMAVWAGYGPPTLGAAFRAATGRPGARQS